MVRWKCGGFVIRREKEKGEKLAGPALNPLKGSSARSSHGFRLCKLSANRNSFRFNILDWWIFVKKRYCRENLLAQEILYG
jgi:hypothetical protein